MPAGSSKSLTLMIIGEDKSASSTLQKVGTEAKAMATNVTGATQQTDGAFAKSATTVGKFGDTVTKAGSNTKAATADAAGGLSDMLSQVGLIDPAVSAVQGPLAGLWSGIKSGAKEAAGNMTMASKSAKMVSGSMALFGGSTKSFGAALKVAGGAAKGFGAAMKTAFLTNGIGIAITGVAALISLFNDKSSEAAASVTDLSNVIDDQTGAFKDNAKAALASSFSTDDFNKSGKSTLATMAEMGVKTGDVTDAMMGNSAAAQRMADVLAGNLARAKAEDAAASYQTENGTVTATAATEKAQAVSDSWAAQLAVVTSKQQELAAAQLEANTGMTQAGIVYQNVAGAAGQVIKPTTIFTGLLGDQSRYASETRDALSVLTSEIDTLAGRTPDASKATKDLNDQVRDIKTAFTDGTKATHGNIESLITASGAIDTTSEAGSKLYDQLEAYRGAADANTNAVFLNSLKTKDMAGAMGDARVAADDARAKFLAQADALGINKEAAHKMADQLGIVDGIKITDKDFKVIADGLQAQQEAVDTLSKTQIANKTFTVSGKLLVSSGNASVDAKQAFASLGLGLASGGQVTGGVAGIDSVPAMLTPREWVLTTGDVDRMGGPAGVASFVNDLRGRPAVQHFEAGGLVGSAGGSPGFSIQGMTVIVEIDGQQLNGRIKSIVDESNNRIGTQLAGRR